MTSLTVIRISKVNKLCFPLVHRFTSERPIIIFELPLDYQLTSKCLNYADLITMLSAYIMQLVCIKYRHSMLIETNNAATLRIEFALDTVAHFFFEKTSLFYMYS